MKEIIYLLTLLILASCTTSNQEVADKTKPETVVDLTAEENVVKKVMKTYKETLESLDVTESYALFF